MEVNNNMGYFVLEYYKMGLYTDEDLNLFVSVGYITEEEKNKAIEDKKNKEV